MGTLMGFAGFLSKLGFIKWATVLVGGYIPEGSWIIAFVMAILINTYSHYVFASLTTHISAMFVAFSAIAISAGAPPMLTLLMVRTSNLCVLDSLCSRSFSSNLPTLDMFLKTHGGNSVSSHLLST